MAATYRLSDVLTMLTGDSMYTNIDMFDADQFYGLIECYLLANLLVKCHTLPLKVFSKWLIANGLTHGLTL